MWEIETYKQTPDGREGFGWVVDSVCKETLGTGTGIKGHVLCVGPPAIGKTELFLQQLPMSEDQLARVNTLVRRRLEPILNEMEEKEYLLTLTDVELLRELAKKKEEDDGDEEEEDE